MENRLNFSPPWKQRWDYIPVWTIWFISTVALAFSMPMGDSNRDLFHALNIVQGVDLPLAGPAIVHRMHYGPMWFYVLAIPLFVCKSWLAVSLWVGALASSVYPMIYAVGRRLFGRSVGLGACFVLALPSWAAIYFVVYSHTNLIPAAVTLTALTMIKWHSKPSWGLSMLLGLVVSIALHTHITASGIGLAALVLLVATKQQSIPEKLLNLSMAAAGFLLPFVPYIWQQYNMDWYEFTLGTEVTGSLDLVANVLAIPSILRSLMTGPWIALKYVATLGSYSAFVASALIGIVWLTGLVGLFKGGRGSVVTPKYGLIFAAILGLLITGVIIRNFTPFYQVLGLLVPLALLAGVGLVQFAGTKGLMITMVLAITLQFSLVSGQWQASRSGVFSLDTAMIGDMRKWRFTEPKIRWLLPSYARDDNARFLCQQQGEWQALGQWAAALEASNLLEKRIHCPQVNHEVWLMNGEVRALAGIHLGMAAQLELDAIDSIGPFQIIQPMKVFDHGEKLKISDPSIYPPRNPYFGSDTDQVDYQIQLGANEVLIVVNALNVWEKTGPVELRRNDELIAPVYDDKDSLAFECGDCGEQPLRLTVNASSPRQVQVFTLPRRQSH